MRAAMYLLVAHHIAALAGRRTVWCYARAAALIACGLQREIFLCVLVGEAIVVLLERRAPTAPPWVPAIILIGALVVAGLWKSSSRNPALLALGAAAVAWWAISRPPVGRWCAKRGLPLAFAGGLVFLAAMWFLPFERWIGNPDSSWQRRLAHFCFNHALRPFPIAAIEKVGEWAERNTPKDSLFLIPPGKEQAGFHPWARRSVVFTVKFFPYSRAGVKEWKNRYLAVRGLTDADSSKVEAALHDLGAKGTGKDYENLSLGRIVDLAATYGADYIVSEHDPPYETPKLAVVFESVDSDSRRGKPLRVYRVIQPAL